MKIQKTLLDIIEQYNLNIKVITYKVAWCNAIIKRKGYDLIKKDGSVWLILEPKFYNNGDKWLVNFKEHSGIFYIKSLKELPKLIEKLFDKDLNPKHIKYKTVCY